MTKETPDRAIPKEAMLEKIASTGSENAASTPDDKTPTAPIAEQNQSTQEPEKAHLRLQGVLHCQTRLSTFSQLSVNACCAPSTGAAVPAAAAATAPRRRMTLSKSNRIIILLVVDSAFFLLELVVGYAVHSLALVADAFHMLNDVLSLLVGLWAVKVANNRGSSAMYTYGWQRAETLGALVNGVFLVALCLSIFLEAIQRFVEPQVVSNPKLVVIVGCMGLASNILGLALFHNHGHSHGTTPQHGAKPDMVREAEEGQGQNYQDTGTADITDESGNIADVLPQAVVGVWRPRSDSAARRSTSLSHGGTPTARTRATPPSHPESRSPHHTASASFGRGFGSVDRILSHPAHIRNDIILASRREEHPGSDAEDEAIAEDSDSPSPNEQSSLLDLETGSPRERAGPEAMSQGRHKRNKSKDHQDSLLPDQDHNGPDVAAGKGHDHVHPHTDLNIRGVFLHVIGDALGNIGVIASALFIWLSSYSWRYYIDPAISLLITIIILLSAIPLCKAASRILLQAVPIGLSVDEIKAEIEQLPGIISCHHLHVWQLSDTKIVASLHIQIHCEVQGTGSANYMQLARQVRQCLHGFGIHSSTIQPEFCLPNGEEDHSLISDSTAREDGTASQPRSTRGGKASKAGSVISEPGTCLLDCGNECADKDQCCPLPIAKQ